MKQLNHEAMTKTNILQQRLSNQHLTGQKFSTPYEAVVHLGAVQSHPQNQK